MSNKFHVSITCPSCHLMGVLEDFHPTAPLRKALEDLLDATERTAAGFPQPLETRYAIRDQARAALQLEKRCPPIKDGVCTKCGASTYACACPATEIAHED